MQANKRLFAPDGWEIPPPRTLFFVLLVIMEKALPKPGNKVDFIEGFF